MSYGYIGKVLNANLTEHKVSVEALRPAIPEVLGGMGYGAKVLYEEVGQSIDPLSSDNIVVIATGPLTGTQAPCAGRVQVTSKSPLNGGIGTGNFGGEWGVELKRAGYDAIILRGCSSRPVYIWIDGARVQIEDAQHLWGKDAWETTDILRQELGEADDIKIIAIGQAGENLVKYACLIGEYYHAQARGGIGAVMGSKRVKAVAVRGCGQVNVAKPEEFDSIVAAAVKTVTHSWGPSLQRPGALSPHKQYMSFGALPFLEQIYEEGSLPGLNFQTPELPWWTKSLTLEEAKRHIIGHKGDCFRCPMSCFNAVEVKKGKYAGLRISSGTFAAPVVEFGAKLGIRNFPAVWKCKEVCHRYGLDFTSAAGTIAFAMELFQRGIITTTDTHGMKLNWGDEDVVLTLLEDIAHRRGLGDILAEGSQKAAHVIGKEAERYALTIKGLEIFGSDPRASARLWAMGHLDNPRGGDNVLTSHTHMDRIPSADVIRQRFNMSVEEYWKNYIDKLDIFPEEKQRIFPSSYASADSYEGKPAFLKWMGDYCSVLNSLTVCILPATILGAFGPTVLGKLLSAATGDDVTPRQLMKAGERIFNLMRMYLVRCGYSRKDDCWPDRFYSDSLPAGPRAGTKLSRASEEQAMAEYYRLRGWDSETGVPSPEKLSELGLSW